MSSVLNLGILFAEYNEKPLSVLDDLSRRCELKTSADLEN